MSKASWLASVALTASFMAEANAEIIIGTTGPLSGEYAAFGEQMRRGAEQAVADINAAGGILGQQVRLELGDDACDPRRAVGVANQMVNKGIVFMAGHFCSGASIDASNVYAEESILQISPASTNPLFTERGLDNVFRVCGRDDQQGAFAGNFAVDNKIGTRVAVLDDKTAYGKGLADEFKRQLEARGVEAVLDTPITAGTRDFAALITKMKEARIDLIYLGGDYTEAGLITLQAHEQGLEARMMSGDSLVNDAFWSITGKAGNGTLMTFSPDPRADPAAAQVVSTFKDAGYDPEGYTLYTYAAIQIFKAAAEAAGTTELDALIPVLRDDTFKTVIGGVDFDDKGDRLGANFEMYSWTDGSYAPVDQP